MIVIYKKGTRNVIKGVRYEATEIYNDGTSAQWAEGRLVIKGIGRYLVKNFTDVSGNPIPKVKIDSNAPSERLDFNAIKVGDILVCKTDRYKCLSKDCKYRVEKLMSQEIEHTSYSGRKYTTHIQKIRFEGINQTYSFWGFNFRKLSTAEAREISIGSLFGEKSEIIKKVGRKIDMVSDKNLTLMSFLSESILDKKRHHLSILDWACQKNGNQFSVDTSDYKDLLDMKLSDILKLIDHETKS